MGPGYVVAAFLEAAGLIGLVVAAVVMRTEHRAKAAELRSFLRSGQMPLPASGSASASRWGQAAPRIIDIPVVPHRRDGAQGHDSAARSALGRAIARGDRRSRPGLTTPISAG
ncbi:hypothetical protein [Methylobacterium sp. NEAU K]|uniref:hypothetical protein n=1 Tax=Methylobacterium sp. NEAU K TaxID=3064946 RepID=UPI002736F829|nr:hypothetical protein [Methylobacterium sp. NEAU K]MDP4003457.1 hypothetical protein [Methylobacterium sp. NEAU K]